MTQHTLRGTIILDACFLDWLEQFDAHCRNHMRDQHKTPDELPLGLLNKLAEGGCRLVIPNEVMKEMFRVSGGRVGLDIDTHGSASLNMQLLNESRNLPLLRRFIAQHKEHGTLHCFGSAEDFNAAMTSGQLKGGLSIVNEWQPKDSPGFNPLFRDKDSERCRPGELSVYSHGDDEILALNSKLRDYPLYTFTKDGGLAINIKQQLGSHLYTLFPSQYVCLFGAMGLTADAQAFEDLLPQLPERAGRTAHYISDHDRDKAGATAGRLCNAQGRSSRRPGNSVHNAQRGLSNVISTDTPSTWRR